MDAIIDLAGDTDREILHSTAVGGLLGGRALHDEPLGSYLETDERPAYVLRNKKRGLRISTPSGVNDHVPDDSYQTLALVTDVRVLVVVGREAGDEQFSLGFDEVVQTGSDKRGFRTHVLTIETLADETWEFACRDDPADVAAYIDGAAQGWANAERLLDDVESQFERAKERLADGHPDDAMGTIEGTEATIRRARERAESVGTIVSRQVEERASDLESQLPEIRHHSHAVRGSQAHARAQTAWRDETYVQAAQAYDTAIAAYERALDHHGSTPGETKLRRRIRGAAAERELLRVGPLVDAETVRRRAQRIDHAQEAADEWVTALEAYRDLLGLEWGSQEQSFVGERSQIKQRAASVADDAIEDHVRAGKQWLHAGDKLAADDESAKSERVYEQAREQLVRARELAREVKPTRVSEIEDVLAEVNERRAGNVPTEKPKDEPVSVDAVDGIVPSETTTSPEPATEDGAIAEPATEDETTAEPDTDRSAGSQDDGPSFSDGDDGWDETDVLEALRGLDEAAFTALVADIWSARGWSTTVFSATSEAVYDIVAIQSDPEEYRMLLWTVQQPQTGRVGRDVIERCVAARDSSEGADDAILVTTGKLTETARNRAEKRGIGIVDGDDLVERVLAEGLVATLEEQR